MVTRHCATVHRDSLEEGRQKEVRILRNHKAFGVAIEKLYSKSLHKQVEKNRCTFDFSEMSIKCLKQKTATKKKNVFIVRKIILAPKIQ